MLNRDALARLGIDVEEGIACCAGDPEFFDEMVVEYLDESAERLAELAHLYKSRDWPQYTRCAHSIKSTSMMIGARSLADLARTMESAGKEGDEAAILAKHDHFLGQYADLAANLRAVVDAARCCQ